MARKTLGFVPMVWECPSCKTQNPGPIKSCTNCGAPQPADVEFYLLEEDKFNFIKDEALLREIKAGPNIHCPYCGTRNPATNQVCLQCGGDLSQGGKVRQSGQEAKTLSELQSEAQSRPDEETSTTPNRRTWIFALVGVLLLALCIVLAVVFLTTDDITGTVTDLQWERSINIEAYTNVTKAAFIDEIPVDGDIISCNQEYHYTSDTPVANATEVCVTIRSDTGSGAAKVEEDCTYEVYDDYCEYTIMEWVVVDTAVASGTDLDPYWPNLDLELDEQEGTKQENYLITFSADGDPYQYSTTDSYLFEQAEIGSLWTLSVNKVGGVQSIEPAN